MFEHRPVTKQSQTSSKRIAKTQRQKGDINDTADKLLKARSHGVCELCGTAWAVQRAHLTGRKQIDHLTTVNDLAHVCVPCHNYLDQDPRGIQARRMLAAIIEFALLQHEGRGT